MLVLNVLGALIYLVVGKFHWWAIPEERAMGIYAVSGEPFIWFLFSLYFFAVYLMLNLAWGGIILKCRYWRGGRFWLSAAMVWIVAIVIDFAHH